MLRSSTCAARVSLRGLSSASENQLTGKVSLMEEKPARKGRFQHWRRPVYISPNINPLEVGPDFSFEDGRPVYFTSKIQLDHKMEQVRLAKKIVHLLADVRKMQESHKIAENERNKEVVEEQRWRPKAKGQISAV